MTPCPHCGAVREHHGRFVVEGNPPAVRLDGRLLPLSATRAAMLALLVRQERVTYAELNAFCRPDNKSNPTPVHISYLRRQLPAGFAILSIPTVGYQLTRHAPANPGTTRP